MKPVAKIPAQEELALVSLIASKRFPGKHVLRVRDVAVALDISEKQVADLITMAHLVAFDISCKRPTPTPSTEMTEQERRKVRRVHWRIAASDYDAFLASRRNV